MKNKPRLSKKCTSMRLGQILDGMKKANGKNKKRAR